MEVVSSEYDDIRFPTLLRLIVTQSSDAVHKLREVQDRAKLPHTGGFMCYKHPNSIYSCDCWYDLEYFDFIQNKTVNTDLLKDVCETLDRGKCKHVVDHEQQGEDPAKVGQHFYTTLIHAAAASGNEPVVEYLAGLSTQSIFSSSQTGIMPLHIAAIKCQHRLYRYLHNSMSMADHEQKKVLKTEMTLVHRDTENMAIERRVVIKNDAFKVLANMLLLFNITDASTVRNMVRMEQTKNVRIAYLVIYLILNGAIDVTITILSTCQLEIKKEAFDFAAEVMIACVLADADDVLENFIAEGFNVKVNAHGYNLLDVAGAFGSEKCSKILKQSLTETKNIHHKLSPFNFLVMMVCSFKFFDTLIDSVGTFLMTKCLRQGFDLNATDEKFRVPPLHVALWKTEKFVKPLLSLGANVDSKYLDKTPLYLSICIRPSCSYFTPTTLDIGVLKTILFHNPVPGRTNNALHSAVKYDLHTSVPKRIASNEPIKFINDKSVEGNPGAILATTSEERCLAISAFALLHEFGFSSEASCEDLVKLQINDTMYGIYNTPYRSKRLGFHHDIAEYETFRDHIRNAESNPRTLKSICRIAIRRTYPGNKLHECLRKASFPKLLVDYIVWPYILWPTTAERNIP